MMTAYVATAITSVQSSLVGLFQEMWGLLHFDRVGGRKVVKACCDYFAIYLTGEIDYMHFELDSRFEMQNWAVHRHLTFQFCGISFDLVTLRMCTGSLEHWSLTTCMPILAA